MKITILTPVYNDWKSASKLIENINTIVKDLDAEFSLVIVNDASTEEKHVLHYSFRAGQFALGCSRHCSGTDQTPCHAGL